MVGTATADSSGNWTLTVTTSLTDGTHMATALARDAAGNASPSSTAVSFTVDTAPPAAPVVVLPANAATIGDNTPAGGGTSQAGARLAGFGRKAGVGAPAPRTHPAGGLPLSPAPGAAPRACTANTD